MKIVAITGSIGCGKTYIANIIRSLGYSVYDIDKWVKYLYFKEYFLDTIKKEFPESFINDKFNKRVLRNIVFNDNDKLKKLESLIHPFLKQKLLNLIRKQSKRNCVIFLDIALLFEMHWDKYCDYIVLADVDKDIQKNRVMKRDNITEEDFNKIISVQLDNEFKKKFSTIIVDTNKPYGVIKSNIIKFIGNIV